MKALVLVHRWLGVGFCLLFAMWFASGIVMHFVPFPSLTETARFAGLSPIDPSRVQHGPDEAVDASHITGAQRVRLIQREDGPVYVVSGGSRPVALHAADLSSAAVTSGQAALDLAKTHARQRGLDVAHATLAGVSDYDQWSVPNDFDEHRPLYRVALNDVDGTELYVSSATGEVVLGTTRFERAWNYAGSVIHWIYPTILRSNWLAWDVSVWALSLVALIVAVSGVVLGVIKLKISRHGVRSPFRGWHAWHHIFGLVTATFLTTWIFSGWLSMDHGLLFSRGRLSEAETAALARAPDWARVHGDQLAVASPVKEVEWFAFGDHIYRRERTGLAAQSLAATGSGTSQSRPYLTAKEVEDVVGHLAPDCAPPFVVGNDDDYSITSSMPGAPVYRSICGDVWFQIDGATGAMLERLDGSRRAYRWVYTGLHTLDFPVLMAHPLLRTNLIVVLCGIGFLFSVTGVVIGWRRLRFHFPPHPVVSNPQARP